MMLEWPIPTNIKELQQLLDFASCCCQCIVNYIAKADCNGMTYYNRYIRV